MRGPTNSSVVRPSVTTTPSAPAPPPPPAAPAPSRAPAVAPPPIRATVLQTPANSTVVRTRRLPAQALVSNRDVGECLKSCRRIGGGLCPPETALAEQDPGTA